MKRLLVFATMLTAALSMGAQSYTPNCNLFLPPQGYQPWTTPMNENLTLIDDCLGVLQNAYQGVWSGATIYAEYQQVSYNGAIYISLQNSNYNQDPATATTYWQYFTGSGGGGGGTLSVDGTAVSNPNLDSTTPTADAGYTLGTWKHSGSNISVEVPTGGGSTGLLAGANVVFTFDSQGFDDSLNTEGATTTVTAVSISSSGVVTLTGTNTLTAGQWIDGSGISSPNINGCGTLGYYGTGNKIYQVLSTGLSGSQFEIQTLCTTSTGSGGTVEDATYFLPVQTAAKPAFSGINSWSVRNGVDVASIYGGYTGLVCEQATNFAAMFGDLFPSVTGKPLILLSSAGVNDIYSGDSAGTVEGCFQSFWSQAHAVGAVIVQNMIGSHPGAWGANTDLVTKAVNDWLILQGKSTTNAASGQYWDYTGVDVRPYGEIDSPLAAGLPARYSLAWNAALETPGTSVFTQFTCNGSTDCVTLDGSGQRISGSIYLQQPFIENSDPYLQFNTEWGYQLIHMTAYDAYPGELWFGYYGDTDGVLVFTGAVGPSTAPTGSCGTGVTTGFTGEWVHSQDAKITYCNGTNWVDKTPSGGGTTTNALTAAATGGAAPGTTFDGSAARTFDYHSFGAQAALSLLAGTYADGDMCTYAATGTLLNCNTAPYSLPTATSSVLGGVKPDGTSILNTAGVISATPASIGAQVNLGATQTGAIGASGTATFPGTVAAGATTPTTIGSSGVLLNGVPALQSQTSLDNYYSGGAGNLTGTGSQNTANGFEALFSNTTGYNNAANGFQALYSNTTGYDNTANGLEALYFNTTGYNNAANGFQALYSNTTGYDNTANGYQALYSNTTGNSNAANGFQALYSNTTGSGNSANGLKALYANTTGNYNTANGLYALFSNTTGSYNTANGLEALYDNTTGYGNSANGYAALFSNTTGNNNTANGVQAGQYIADGVTANQTSSSSVYEGFQAYPLASGDTNENVIGNTAIGHGSNTTTLGNSSTIGTWKFGTQHITATAPTASAGSVAAYSTNAGGEITGLSAATSVTITFANSGWTNAAFCVVTPDNATAIPYISAISKTGFTITFTAAETGVVFYHCDGN